MTERKELIDRLRWHAKSMCNGDMYREAADMLEADAPAATQEPVAWQYRGRPAVNREWGEWHTVGHKPKGPECTRFMMRPLFAAPQPQPRLTDAEILTLWAQTYVERGTSGIEFARAIEAAVMKKVTL